jgi:hypothetical protein
LGLGSQLVASPVVASSAAILFPFRVNIPKLASAF